MLLYHLKNKVFRGSFSTNARWCDVIKTLTVATAAETSEWHMRVTWLSCFLSVLSLLSPAWLQACAPSVGSPVGTAGDLLHRTTAKTMEVLTTTGLTTKAVLTAVSDHRWWKESINFLRPLHVSTLWLFCFQLMWCVVKLTFSITGAIKCQMN